MCIFEADVMLHPTPFKSLQSNALIWLERTAFFVFAHYCEKKLEIFIFNAHICIVDE